MKKFDYLRKVIKQGVYKESKWFFSSFALTREADNAWKLDPYELRVVREPWGIGFVENGEVVKFSDAKANEPLFSMQEPIVIDETWVPNVKGPTETNVGSLMVNQMLLVDNYGAKIPFIPYRVEISNIENFIIVNRAKDIPGKPRDPTKIYLDEYLGMTKAVEYIRTLPTLSTSSLTDRNMTKPDGLDAKKKEVLAKYGGDLSDPVNLALFEKEMLDWSDSYRKGDPSDGKMVKGGKYRGNSLRKMFVSSGAEGGMGPPMVPIVESLADGLKYDAESIRALINGSRSGSYFRGLDTVKGGVSFKLVVRVLASFMVGEIDCKSTLGVQVTYDKNTIKQLLSRLIVGQEKRIETIEEAGTYLGKMVTLRSPGFCRSKSSVICQTCAGPRLSGFPEGLAIPASDITGAILAASMAAMHKNTTEVTTLDLFSVLS